MQSIDTATFYLYIYFKDQLNLGKMKFIKDIYYDNYGTLSWPSIIGTVIIVLVLFITLDRISSNSTKENVIIMDKEVERYNRNSPNSYYLKIQYMGYYDTATIEVSHGIYESFFIGDTTHINIYRGGITDIPYKGTIVNPY
jgi:hypothetical protein